MSRGGWSRKQPHRIRLTVLTATTLRSRAPRPKTRSIARGACRRAVSANGRAAQCQARTGEPHPDEMSAHAAIRRWRPRGARARTEGGARGQRTQEHQPGDSGMRLGVSAHRTHSGSRCPRDSHPVESGASDDPRRARYATGRATRGRTVRGTSRDPTTCPRFPRSARPRSAQTSATGCPRQRR